LVVAVSAGNTRTSPSASANGTASSASPKPADAAANWFANGITRTELRRFAAAEKYSNSATSLLRAVRKPAKSDV